MQLRLPSKFSDLKLRHLQALHTEDDPIRRIDAVTGLGVSKLREMPMPLITEADRHLKSLLFTDVSKHRKVIELKGVRYGFIPDWESFTAGEWIDMELYTQDFWKTAHKAMSILYRPIEREFGDTYEVKPYTAKEDADVFKEMSAPLVSGALLFFWTSEKRLVSLMRQSLAEGVREVESLQRNGDGTQLSTSWLVRTFYKWTLSPSYLWGMSSLTWLSSKIWRSKESKK